MDIRIIRKARSAKFLRPEDHLRKLVDRAPAAEAFADQAVERLRPKLDFVYEFRTRFATGAVVAVAAWLFIHVVFGANGAAAYTQKKSDYKILQKDIARLQQENDDYTARIKGLQSDPKMIEKEAREQLHYAKPGEVIIVSPPDPQPAAPTELHSAQK